MAPGAMLTSLAGTGATNLHRLPRARAWESPRRAGVSRLSPPGVCRCPSLHEVRDGGPVRSLQVRILLMSGSGAGTRLWSGLGAALVAHACPAGVGAEILALRPECKVCVWVLTEPGSCLDMIHLPSPSREVHLGTYEQAGSSSVKH